MLADAAEDLGAGIFALIIVIWGLVSTILWLCIGWRAMRAHERIASAIERSAINRPPNVQQ